MSKKILGMDPKTFHRRNMVLFFASITASLSALGILLTRGALFLALALQPFSLALINPVDKQMESIRQVTTPDARERVREDYRKGVPPSPLADTLTRVRRLRSDKPRH